MEDGVLVTDGSQRIFGASKNKSILKFTSGFATAAPSGGFMFVSNANNGPYISDLGFTFDHGTITTRGALINYPAAIFADNNPRFLIERIEQPLTLDASYGANIHLLSLWQGNHEIFSFVENCHPFCNSFYQQKRKS